MVKFEITSEKTETIDAIGMVGPDLPPVVLSDEQVQLFKAFHGVSITEANFPPHISVTAFVADVEPAEEV
ncbi:MAG TPA: hypothetical protein V6C65_19280 [Allocoleopsis sp.]